MGGNPSGDLGFTFSFPVDQTALNAGTPRNSRRNSSCAIRARKCFGAAARRALSRAGTLVCWNKGFTAAGVVGHDVVDLLQKQLHSRGIQLTVKALANDTVGTMEAAAYKYADCSMGVILGTGTNAAYVERTSHVGKWRGAPSEEMVINTEWGNLNMQRWMNSYDRAIDAASTNPTKQTFEKMMSGMCAEIAPRSRRDRAEIAPRRRCAERPRGDTSQ